MTMIMMKVKLRQYPLHVLYKFPMETNLFSLMNRFHARADSLAGSLRHSAAAAAEPLSVHPSSSSSANSCLPFNARLAARMSAVGGRWKYVK